MNMQDFREQIDRIDTQLLDLFAKRMEVARLIGEYKEANNLAVRDPERERQKIDNAAKALEEIAAIISERKKDVAQTTEGPIPRFFSYVVGAYFNGHMVNDRKFMVDEEVCIKCGKCAKVCPVDNISGTPPTWLHHGQCTCCLACYHHCPVHAINYGERTRKRGQYFFKLKKKD